MFLRKTYTYFYSINLAQKIFWVCFFLSTLSLTIVPSIIMLQYTNVLQKQIEKKNIAALNQLSKLTDAMLAEENFRHVQYLASTLEHYHFLSPKDSTVSTYHVFKNWENYTIIHPNLYSCCLYSKSSDTFLSSLEGFNYHFLSSASLPYAKHLAHRLENTVFANKPFWISTSSFSNPETQEKSTKILTFVQPCSILFPVPLQDHYLLLNYNMNHLEEQILPILDPNGYFEVLNTQNQLLYSGKDSDNAPNNYNMYSEVSSVSGWTYRYFVPTTFWGNPLSITLFFGLAVIFSGLFLAFFLSKFLSRKLYRPLSNLLATIHSHSNTDTLSKNDIDFIQNTFHELYSSKEIIDNNLSLLEYQIGQLIFKGKIAAPSEISEKLKLTSFPLDADNYRLMILAFSPEVVQSNPMLPYESIAFIKETLLCNQPALCVPYPENCISLLLANIPTPSSGNDFQQLRHELSSIFECPCTLFSSASLQSFSEISSSFSALKTGLSYLSLYGYGQVIHQELIDRHEKTKTHLSPLFLPSIEKLLDNSPEKLSKKCTEALDYAKSKTIHYEYWMDFCHTLCYTLETHSHNHNLHTAFSKLKKDCFPIALPQDYIRLCESYTALLEDTTLQRKKSNPGTDEYIEEIKQYILENISPELSLESIADKFCLTPNYLSKIFHEHCQITFSTFLKEAKLKKAAELLKNNDMLIQNIAETVGYNTPNYFNRIFKDYYGVTPLQYRRKYL